MGTVLLGVFLLFTILNLIYFFSFFAFAAAGNAKKTSSNPPISVIVCAKNEAENLKSFLPAILDQAYPDFEVIVINDASTDATLDIIEMFQEQDPRVKKVNVQNNEAFWANKKYALTLGIKKAQNKFLLFTDADCAPQSQNWISEMAANFQPDISIVLGYGGYFKNTGSLLNKLIRFETLLTAIQYFSYAKLGSPYMGVGRNLAYTAPLFYNLKGFASHLHLRSGDDDLFVNEAATSTNTAICFSSDSITRSVPKKKFSEWFHQKKRHISVAGEYKRKHQLLLGGFYMVRVMFWILFAILLIINNFPEVVLGALGVKLLVEGIIYYKAAKKLEEIDVIWLFPFLDLFLIFMQLVIFISNLVSKPKHWK